MRPHRDNDMCDDVKGLLFDLGDVLYDATVWRRWLLQLLARMGLSTTYRSFFRVWDREHLEAVYRGEQTCCEALGAFLRSAGLTRAQTEEVLAASLARRRELEATTRPFPGVRTTLARLQAGGLQLGILTNSEWAAADLESRLSQFGMAAFFATIVTSVDLHRTLPDAACYRTAVDGLGLSAHEVVYVGHDMDELAGAARFGLQTAAFNASEDAIAQVSLERFEDLGELFLGRNLMAAAG